MSRFKRCPRCRNYERGYTVYRCKRCSKHWCYRSGGLFSSSSVSVQPSHLERSA